MIGDDPPRHVVFGDRIRVRVGASPHETPGAVALGYPAPGLPKERRPEAMESQAPRRGTLVRNPRATPHP